MGTREIQLCLLKIALMFGVQVHFGIGICGILRSNSDDEGNMQHALWRAWSLPSQHAREFLANQHADSQSAHLNEHSNKVPAELSVKIREQDTSRLKKSKVDYFERAESTNGAAYNSLGIPYLEGNDLVNRVELFEFNALLIADGESSRLIQRLGFDRKVMRFSEAIGIVITYFAYFARCSVGCASMGSPTGSRES